MQEGRIKELTDQVRQTSLALHTFLRNGHLEKVYENGLAHRLRKLGIEVKQQQAIRVHDEDGTVLGDFCADLLVEGELIVELKACKTLAEEHTAQLFGYLRATGIEHGILVNFGAPKLQIHKYIFNR